MSAPTLVQPAMVDVWRRARGSALTIGLGLIALGLLFQQEIAAAIHTWITSTAYNHCFLVLPIVGYLIWDRRDTLRGATTEPMPWVTLLAIPVAIVWLAAERLGIMEGRQLMAISFVLLLLLAVLGWKFCWLLCGPLLYLYFLVPFGDFLTPKLQDFTTFFVRHGLDIIGIPSYIDGFTIQIPEGAFYIATACAGLRFLIASIAFGCLYALLIYRSPMRRAIFIIVSIIVPIIANGFRALGIVVLGYILNSAEAAATDHVLYGWIFFSLVILLLIGFGLPLREDQVAHAAPPRDLPRQPPDRFPVREAALAAGLLVAFAAISPAVATALDVSDRAVAAAVPPIDFGPGCTRTPIAAPVAVDARGPIISFRVFCSPMTMDVNVEVLPRYSTAAPLLAEQRRLVTIPDSEEAEISWLATPPGQPHIWRKMADPQYGPMIAFALFVDGKPVTPSLALRAQMAWTSIVGARVAPVLVTVTPRAQWGKINPTVRDEVEKWLGALLSRPALIGQLARVGG